MMNHTETLHHCICLFSLPQMSHEQYLFDGWLTLRHEHEMLDESLSLRQTLTGLFMRIKTWDQTISRKKGKRETPWTVVSS